MVTTLRFPKMKGLRLRRSNAFPMSSEPQTQMTRDAIQKSRAERSKARKGCSCLQRIVKTGEKR